MSNIYALVVDSLVANIVCADTSWISEQQGTWVQIPLPVANEINGGAGIGYTYDEVNDVFVAPPTESDDQ